MTAPPILETSKGTVGALGRKTPMPPLRADPFKEDAKDSERVAYFTSLIRSQDGALLTRDREVEGNIRMLAGQQWEKWHPVLQRYMNVGDWFGRNAKKGTPDRVQAVVNRLLHWYMITHARMTENPPVGTWVPGPDKRDAELCEVLDVLTKLQWRNAGMNDALLQMYAWLIPGGESYIGSRIDLTKGAYVPWQATTHVVVYDEFGNPMLDQNQQPLMMEAENVPLNEQYEPQAFMKARMGLDGQVEPLGLQLAEQAEPHQEHEGAIAVDVYSPFACRGEWGDKLWKEKSWHSKTGYYTPEQAFDLFGVELNADEEASGSSGVGVNESILEQAMFGSGWYEAAGGMRTNTLDTNARGNLIRIDEVWLRPNPLVKELRDGPNRAGGRHTVFTPKRIILDREREVAYPYTSPIERFQFLQMAGSPVGRTLQTALNPLQRAHNKSASQVADHGNLVANPIALVDQQSGFDIKNWNNAPGTRHVVNKRQGVDPISWMQPPQLGQAVYDQLAFTRDAMEEIGSTRGSDGAPQTDNESGEARRERRYDSDRYVGPTQHGVTRGVCRTMETWRAMMPRIYTTARVVHDAGEDQAARTIMVLPELFEQGTVNMRPDLGANLPESRDERQARWRQLYKDGMLGDTPDEARRNYFEQANFPNLSNVIRAGNVDTLTASQENGAMMRGEQCPVLPFYDHQKHIAEHLRIMKGREFLKLDPPIQQAYTEHVQMHEQMAAMMAPPPMDLPPEGAPAPGPRPSQRQVSAPQRALQPGPPPEQAA